jgi:hypothetical protein
MKDKFGLIKPLERFLQVLFLFWFLMFFIGWIERVLHLHGGMYPLFLRDWRFSDFTIYPDWFRYFHQAMFFQLPRFYFCYPAPVAIVLDGFIQFGAYALSVYLAFCFLTFMGAGLVLGRAMIHYGMGMAQTVVLIGSSMLLSYPFWFLIDRANIEMVNWLIVALGVACYWNKRWYLAAAFFGVAISFKIFPFVFLGLLLSARKYWAVAWGIVICALTTCASTWFIGPTYRIASEGIAKGLDYYRVQYAMQVHTYEIGFDHSLFAIIKGLTHKYYVQALHHQLTPVLYYLPWLYGYMAVAAAAGLILYCWRIRTLPRVNQILALTVASIMLPPVSGDYTLVHLYIPWGVLVLVTISLKDAHKVRGLVLSFVCMAFLMAPESFAVIYGIRIAGQLKAIVLLILFIVSITYPFEEPASNSDDVLPLTRPGIEHDSH